MGLTTSYDELTTNEYRSLRERAQKLLDATKDLAGVEFSLKDIQALRPPDRQRFVNRFLDASEFLEGKLVLRQQAIVIASYDEPIVAEPKEPGEKTP
jgi:hypothetical protein